MLTGSARLAQEARDRGDEEAARHSLRSERLGIERRRKAIEAQIAALQAELETGDRELKQKIAEEGMRRKHLEVERDEMAVSRRVTQPSTRTEAANSRRGRWK